MAYCLDDAVAYVGNVIQGDLDGVEGETEQDRHRNRQIVLDQYFGDPDKPRPGLYADPALLF